MTKTTLDQIEKFSGNSEVFRRSLARCKAYEDKNYLAFIDILYKDLDFILYQFQANPQLHKSSEEDKISHIIEMFLNTQGYTASHNKQSGGNVDLTVLLGQVLDGFTWIGEAKIYRSIADPREGLLQLVSRYKPASGNYNHVHQGVLLYVYRPEIITLMQDWRDELPSQQPIHSNIQNDIFNNPFAFTSEYTHESGVTCKVRHIGLNLYFKPRDKSGRNRKVKP
jgi:hypothetical protein